MFNLLILLVISSLVPAAQTSTLTRDLLARYEQIGTYARPVNSSLDKLEIHVGLTLHQLVELNIQSQQLTTKVTLTQQWTDNNLAWEPGNYGLEEKVLLPSDQIWTPPMIVSNSLSNPEITSSLLFVNYEGSVEWRRAMILNTQCGIDYEYFPRDRQKCEIKVVSDLNGKMIDWYEGREDIDLRGYYRSTEWNILDTDARYEYEINHDYSVYAAMTYTLLIERKPSTYRYNLVLPSILLTSASCLVFLLPIGSNYIVGVLILLGYVLLQNNLCNTVARASVVSPPPVQYLAVSMVNLTVFLVLHALTMSIRNWHRPVPQWVQKLCNCCGRSLCVTGCCCCSEGECGSRAADEDLKVPLEIVPRERSADLIDAAQEHTEDGCLTPGSMADCAPNRGWIIVSNVFCRILFYIYILLVAILLGTFFPWGDPPSSRY